VVGPCAHTVVIYVGAGAAASASQSENLKWYEAWCGFHQVPHTNANIVRVSRYIFGKSVLC
jgi:hypothetical protein